MFYNHSHGSAADGARIMDGKVGSFTEQFD